MWKKLLLNQVLVALCIGASNSVAMLAWAQAEARSRGPAAGENTLGPGSRYYPDDNYRPNRWQLGVQVRNLENGVLLTSVDPGSVADRNSLVPGDTIITVAGYQVGYVDRRLYDLGDELTRNVDRLGRVTLLVLRRSDGRLINNYVNFSDVGGGTGGGTDDRNFVRGIIEGRGPYSGLRLSSSAVQVVRVLDVSNDNWNNVVVARGVERNPGQIPLNFGLAFDRRDGRNYAADAIIYDGGRQYSTGLVAIDWKRGQTSRVTLSILRDRPIYDPTTWYLSNLGRAPSSREMSVWREQLEQGYSQDEIEAQILGGSEFYDRNKSNPTEYARGVTRAATGREPTPDEVKRLSDQLQQPGVNRSSVVQQMLESLRKQPR